MDNTSTVACTECLQYLPDMPPMLMHAFIVHGALLKRLGALDVQLQDDVSLCYNIAKKYADTQATCPLHIEQDYVPMDNP